MFLLHGRAQQKIGLAEISQLLAVWDCLTLSFNRTGLIQFNLHPLVLYRVDFMKMPLAHYLETRFQHPLQLPYNYSVVTSISILNHKQINFQIHNNKTIKCVLCIERDLFIVKIFNLTESNKNGNEISCMFPNNQDPN